MNQERMNERMNRSVVSVSEPLLSLPWVMLPLHFLSTMRLGFPLGLTILTCKKDTTPLCSRLGARKSVRSGGDAWGGQVGAGHGE